MTRFFALFALAATLVTAGCTYKHDEERVVPSSATVAPSGSTTVITPAR